MIQGYFKISKGLWNLVFGNFFFNFTYIIPYFNTLIFFYKKQVNLSKIIYLKFVAVAVPP